jgi:hypothetical protein
LSREKGILFVAFILAIAGVGLGGYSVFSTIISPASPSLVVQNFWYAEEFGSLDVPQNQYGYIHPLSVLVTMNQGDVIFVSYTGLGAIEPGGSELRVAIYVNEAQIGPATRIEIISPASRERLPIALHGVIDAISPGIHNISVRAYADDLQSQLWRSNLFVLTLKN